MGGRLKVSLFLFFFGGGRGTFFESLTILARALRSVVRGRRGGAGV